MFKLQVANLKGIEERIQLEGKTLEQFNSVMYETVNGLDNWEWDYSRRIELNNKETEILEEIKEIVEFNEIGNFANIEVAKEILTEIKELVQELIVEVEDEVKYL